MKPAALQFRSPVFGTAYSVLRAPRSVIRSPPVKASRVRLSDIARGPEGLAGRLSVESKDVRTWVL